MKVLREKRVLVLTSLLALVVAWVAGCAGMAEPLPTLSVAPSTLSVSTKVGTSNTVPVSVINTGTNPITVNQVVIDGKGFTMSGTTTPMTLKANQTASFSVKFAPTSAGNVTGSVRLVTDSAHRPANMPLNGTGSNTTPMISTVQVSPQISTPAPGGTIKFAALIQGATSNDKVTWSTTIGTITTAGVFTAPMSGGVGRVIAQSVADPTFSASATVSIPSSSTGTGGTDPLGGTGSGSGGGTGTGSGGGTGTGSGGGTGTGSGGTGTGATVTAVVVTPSTAASATGGTLPFRATVQGSTKNTAVTWKAQLGKITAAGEYTAPSKAGNDVVTATSAADSSVSGSATVKVTATASPTVTGVSISPATSSVSTSAKVQFTASVQGTTGNKAVTWSAALGSITASGAYTAPSKAGTDTITAKSEADTSMSASAKVTVAAPAASNPPPTGSGSGTSASCPSSGCPAFPGAEGAGAEAVGGRGGFVMEVTNLNDSGSGSLRACVEASGPRTCIFRVSGLITQRSAMNIQNPYITIAGQTAPGGGIVQGGVGQSGQALTVQTHDVIIRYLTYDGANSGASSGTCNHDPDPGAGGGTVGYEIDDNNNYNIVIDHTSHRWWGNKDMEIVSNGPGQNAHDLSIQWNLMYEPCFIHPVITEPDTFGGGSVQASVNQDWHHNFAMNYDHRWPLLNVGGVRWVNNLGYNGVQNGDTAFNFTAWGGIKADIIGNNYVPGPDTSGHTHNYLINSDPNNTNDPSDCGNDCDYSPTPSVYMLNNIGCTGATTNAGCPIEPATNVPNDTAQRDQVWQGWEGAESPETGIPDATWPSSWFRSSPLPAETFPITHDPVTNLDNVLLGTIGNSQHLDCNGNFVSNRDSQDARVIQQYVNRGHGGPWSGSTYTGPLGANGSPAPPAVPGGTACVESMHDGIPDQWKTARGLSTTDPNLHRATAPNGYTYLENYLNGVK